MCNAFSRRALIAAMRCCAWSATSWLPLWASTSEPEWAETTMVVCAVSISPLPGLTLPSFASRHAAEWFHRSTAKLCYQSQFLIGLAVLSIENARLPLLSFGEGYPRFSPPDCGENNGFNGFSLTMHNFTFR